MSFFIVPTGMYSVGIIRYEICDKHRVNVINEVSIPRRLVVQVWYPTGATVVKPKMHYFDDIQSHWKGLLIKKLQKIESSISYMQDFENLFIQAEYGVPVVLVKQFPLILFSHGFLENRGGYSAYCQELASHGYIVASIGHTYYEKITVFRDGIVHSGQKILFNTLVDEEKSCHSQEEWLDDVSLTVDYLLEKNIDKKTLLYKKISVDSIGIIGHSFGGSTAIQWARRDKRCSVAINLDGGLFGVHATQSFKKPVMIIQAGNVVKAFSSYNDSELAHKAVLLPELIATFRSKYIDNVDKFSNDMPEYVYRIVIPNAGHGVFSDWALLRYLPLYKDHGKKFNLLFFLGDIDGFAATTMINGYIVSFFDLVLKNKKH